MSHFQTLKLNGLAYSLKMFGLKCMQNFEEMFLGNVCMVPFGKYFFREIKGVNLCLCIKSYPRYQDFVKFVRTT